VTDVICVDRSVIGTEQHLLCDGQQQLFIDSIPDNVWHLSGQQKSSGMCLDTLLTLEKKIVDRTPTEKYVRSLLKLIPNKEVQVPWRFILPSDEHSMFIKRIASDALKAFEACDKTYMVDTWPIGQHLLLKLQQAYVDVEKLQKLIDKRAGNVFALQSFIPDVSGACIVPTYNRFGTTTGRLTISHGPDIMTLKKEHRKILRSKWGDKGKIISIDFSALEPHVLLYEAGARTSKGDLYVSINDDLFNGNMERKLIKGGVISVLYGMSAKNLSEKLSEPSDKIDALLKVMKGYFKTKELLKRVKETYVKQGYIRNRYNRLVEVKTPLDHIFVNYYAQSTGADVALLGFKMILDELNNTDLVRPLFLLHDGLFIDCHESMLQRVKLLQDVVVPGYIQKFHLKVE
jgi:DNA polymerase I - 3''-5'' exonuclease and polymerase domains